MNGYTCTKACSFGGVTYSIGDAIPFDAVLPSRERALIKQKFIAPAVGKDEAIIQEDNKELLEKIVELEKTIAEATGTPTGDENDQREITIPITSNGGILELVMTPEDIIMAVATMQLNADEAAKAVGAIEKEETLILIDTLDVRKTVKTAIVARVEAMEKAEEGSQEKKEGQGDV